MALFGYGRDDDKDGKVSFKESIRDMTDGGGKGQTGDRFEGGFSAISNAIGATPKGSGRKATGIANLVNQATGIGGGKPNMMARTIFGGLTGGIPGAIMANAMAKKDLKALNEAEKAAVVPKPMAPKGSASIERPEDSRIKRRAYTTSESMAYAEGGEVMAPDGGNEKSLISNAAAAIQGQLDEQSAALALGAFVQQYGQDALKDFIERVQSGELEQTAARSEGKLSGPGDGMNDRIPASVGGRQDVLLSDGEFIVPADVVSGLGNGSSEAGAKQLEKFMERIRSERTGTAEQPKAIDPVVVLPA